MIFARLMPFPLETAVVEGLTVISLTWVFLGLATVGTAFLFFALATVLVDAAFFWGLATGPVGVVLALDTFLGLATASLEVMFEVSCVVG